MGVILPPNLGACHATGHWRRPMLQSREMTMGTLMWMGVTGVGQIGAGNTKSRELCGPGV